eukprot:3409820-Rhodomonas_salina.1
MDDSNAANALLQLPDATGFNSQKQRQGPEKRIGWAPWSSVLEHALGHTVRGQREDAFVEEVLELHLVSALEGLPRHGCCLGRLAMRHHQGHVRVSSLHQPPLASGQLEGSGLCRHYGQSKSAGQASSRGRSTGLRVTNGRMVARS